MAGKKYPEDWSYEQIKKIITDIPNPKHQSLAALAYATGARVSELNKITKEGIQIQGNYLIIRCPVLKKRDKQEHSRHPVVRLDEEWLVTPIQNHVQNCSTNILFPFSRIMLWKWLKEVTPNFNPHFFRKLRATHLRRNFGFDSYQLKKFFNWSSISPSEYYVGLDTKDIQY